MYDSGEYWHRHECARELDISKHVAEEVWQRYGKYKSFKGWYLNFEVSRAFRGITELYYDMGCFVKALSGNLPTMISPYIDGIKPAVPTDTQLRKEDFIGLETHAKEWDEILGSVQGAVDIVAFQDGHCDYSELADYILVNKAIADKYGMASWTNCESFDRDMPIRFLPIKWEKMLLKLEAARKAGAAKAITFEFSHFMSPNSCYRSAGHLFNRYCEHFKLLK